MTGKAFEIETREERLTITPFTAPDRRSVVQVGFAALVTQALPETACEAG